MIGLTRRGARLFSLACAIAAFAVPAEAQSTDPAEWPQFLGPNRNGISPERNLLESWPTGGPKEVWRVPGGVGMSGLAISGGRLLTLVQTDGQQRLVAFDAKTGQPLWQTEIAPAYSNRMGDGPRATPAIAGHRVFAFSGEGILACVSLSSGRVLWSRNLVQELGGKLPDYGMACSPLVVGDLVVLTPGAPQAAVVAVDAADGEVVWKSGNDPAGYSSPALLAIAGHQQIVAFMGNSLLGLTPSSGEVLWRYPYVTDFDCNIATPLAHNAQVFISSGENHGSVLLRLKESGSGLAVEEVWASQGPRSVLRNEWQTSILLDGYLYGFDNVGGAGPISHLTCVNASTGERAWQQLRFGKGNLIAADGKLFISTLNGELVVAHTTPKGYDEIGRAVVLGPTRQAPALAGGRLYLRDNKEIVCLDVRKN